jgi:hypothetical protein
MIEEFFRALAGVIFRREEKNFDLAREGLDNLSKMISGLSIDQLKKLGSEGLRYFFNANKAEDVEKLYCIARMFSEDALIDEAEAKKEDARTSLILALEILEMIQEKGFEDQEDVKHEIEFIYNKLQGGIS